MNVRFEEAAPLALRRAESLAQFVTALKARPGQWALLGQYSTNGSARQTAYEIRHSFHRAFVGGGFEAQATTLFGEYRVYVRYARAVGRCPTCSRPFENCICTGGTTR